MAASCVLCGRDLYKYGNTTGTTLDGYSTTSNLCKECNRAELRRRGLGAAAHRDEMSDAFAAGFWKVAGWLLLALIVFSVLGLIFA